jgi:hypothetical protein
MNNKLCTKRFWASVIVLIVAAAIVVPPVFAKLALNTINVAATVSQNGRKIIVTGPIEGTMGERCQLRLTVTQRSTGAVAEGTTQLVLRGSSQSWEVVAHAQGASTFVEGPATAVAMATTASRGQTTDAAQWLVEVTLDNE